MKFITRETLANILGLKESTIKVWMNGYRFTKFCSFTLHNGRRALVMEFSKDFIKNLKEYLEVTGHRKELEKLQNFLDNGVKI